MNTRNVTVEKAFANSSNVGISRLVTEHYRTNKEKYVKHITDIGLDKPTGVCIPVNPHRNSSWIRQIKELVWCYSPLDERGL